VVRGKNLGDLGTRASMSILRSVAAAVSERSGSRIGAVRTDEVPGSGYLDLHDLFLVEASAAVARGEKKKRR
jgi:hypothetical protein